jgi:hypothetical protein
MLNSEWFWDHLTYFVFVFFVLEVAATWYEIHLGR